MSMEEGIYYVLIIVHDNDPNRHFRDSITDHDAKIVLELPMAAAHGCNIPTLVSFSYSQHSLPLLYYHAILEQKWSVEPVVTNRFTVKLI